MSTTPVVPTTVASEITTIEKRIGAFLDPAHIILLVLLAAALFVGIYVFESGRVNVAEAKSAAADAALKEAKVDAANAVSANTQLQAAKDAAIAQATAANVQLATANSQLAAAMKAEAAALATQQTVDKTMSPTQQSKRWQQLVPTAVVDPTPNGFQVSASGGLDTLLQLEQVPVLTSQLAKAATKSENDDKIILNDAGVLSAERAKHASDIITDAAVLDAANKRADAVTNDFSTYKKKARRNILRAYAAGVVSGVVLRKVLGF